MPPKRATTPGAGRIRNSPQNRDRAYEPPATPSVPIETGRVTRSQARLTTQREDPSSNNPVPEIRATPARRRGPFDQNTQRRNRYQRPTPFNRSQAASRRRNPEAQASLQDLDALPLQASSNGPADSPEDLAVRDSTAAQVHPEVNVDTSNSVQPRSSRDQATRDPPGQNDARFPSPKPTNRSSRPPKRRMDDSDMPQPKRNRPVQSADSGRTASMAASNRLANLVNAQVPSRYLDFKTLSQPMSRIDSEPCALSLKDIADFFLLLQQMTVNFAKEHFAYSMSKRDQAAWPMHDLSTQYLPLMLITQYIADGGQYTWRRFFTAAEHRVPLVYGILGEWFKQRIFKHTAFGMNDSEIVKLEDVDREYVHYDAFVRTKARADRLRTILGHTEYTAIRKAELYRAASELAEELMLVLTPLLPPPAFEFNVLTRRFEIGKTPMAALKRQEIKRDLTRIITAAANLHRSIRLTGRNGTVIHISQSVPKGGKYFEGPELRMVNRDFINHNLPTGDHDASIYVKMTCWGHVEAVVPHGPDALQMVQAERSYRQRLRDGEEFSWQQHEATMWPLLPHDVHPRDIDVDMEHSGDEGDDHPHHHHRRQQRRGAYVTVYPNLCGSDVYCEWAPDSPLNNDTKTLLQAVQEARAYRGLSCRLQDETIRAWNTVMDIAPHAEWIGVGALGFAIISLARSRLSGSELIPTRNSVISILQRLKALPSSIDLSNISSTILQRLENLPQSLLASVTDAWAKIVSLFTNDETSATTALSSSLSSTRSASFHAADAWSKLIDRITRDRSLASTTATSLAVSLSSAALSSAAAVVSAAPSSVHSPVSAESSFQSSEAFTSSITSGPPPTTTTKPATKSTRTRTRTTTKTTTSTIYKRKPTRTTVTVTTPGTTTVYQRTRGEGPVNAVLDLAFRAVGL